MAKQTTVTTQKFDEVAEVLKEISNGRDVEPGKAKKAIEKYNNMTGDLAFYKKEFEEKDAKSNKVRRKRQDELEKLNEEKTALKKKVNELEQRLSSVLGQKITADNPDIADLSDPHRPTKLVEKFRSLYDDEWTNAYEELDKLCSNKKEDKIISVLVDLIKAVDNICGAISVQQIGLTLAVIKDDLTNPKLSKGKDTYSGDKTEMNKTQENKLTEMVKNLRKELAELSVSPVCKIFYDYKLKHTLKGLKMDEAPKMNEYVRRLIHIIWMMKSQDPPMVLVWPDAGKPVNKDRFTFYTKSGDVVAFVVWPSVLLHKDGPQMSKGVVQGK
ncbi:hypothetical protein ACF0H5_011376 [Mactra antiquata]